MRKYILLIFISALQACSIENKEEAIKQIDANPNVKTINIDNGDYKENISFAEYFNSPKTILLETADNCLIQEVQSLEIYENNIYILDSKANRLFVFDMEGRFLHQIGSPGSGPGEYVQISDFTIDREKRIIYVFDEFVSKVHKYSLQTSQYLSSINIERVGNQTFYLQYTGGKLYLNETAIDGKEPKHLLRMLDSQTEEQEGLFLDSKLYNKGWNLTLRNYHNFFYGKGTKSPKYIEWFMDTIVAVEGDKIYPSYIVSSKDFASENDVKRLIDTYYSNGRSYDFESIASDGKIYHIDNFVESGTFVYFRFEKSNTACHLFYNKQNETVQITEDFTDDYFAKGFSMNQNFCYYDESGAYGVIQTDLLPLIKGHVIDSGFLNPQIDNYDKIKNIKEDSNPIILYYPFK